MREEETFAFIEENVMESKKPKRQFVAGAKRVIWYGLIFGTIAGSTFAIVTTFVSSWLGRGQEPERIALSTTVQPKVSNIPKETKEPNKSELITDEKKLEGIQNIYSLIGKQAKKTNRSLVGISAIQEGGEGVTPLVTNTISGVIVAKTKKAVMILTRYSSIKNIQKMTITFMGQYITTGNLYNYDGRANLAIVKVAVSEMTETALRNIEVVDFGDAEYLERGEMVYVVGQPDGVIGSMEFGYITRESSVLSMEDYQVNIYGISINYHNNGYGVVCNMNGKCLGILDSKYNEGDTTIFVGIDRLRLILENLLNQKKQVYVGINGRGITDEYLEQFNHQSGLYVTDVTVGSPAYEAGIQVGDVIHEINGEKVDGMVKFFECIQNYRPKETIKVTLDRENSNGKKEIILDVKLQERK
ncbi:MAG: serine protease [Lachnospiraceae bacterium]|nr:serine protease [Lachnospiraceae bacterium]